MLIAGCNWITISAVLLFLLEREDIFFADWPPADFSLVELLTHAKIHNQETTKQRQDYFAMEDDRETAN